MLYIIHDVCVVPGAGNVCCVFYWERFFCNTGSVCCVCDTGIIIFFLFHNGGVCYVCLTGKYSTMIVLEC